MMPVCQVCFSKNLVRVLSLGFLPLPNHLGKSLPLPAGLLHCRDCDLVQLDTIIDREAVFPPNYPYTSGTTAALRRNFEDLARETAQYLAPGDLVVDIGSNDGTLLSNFSGYRRLGVEPTDVAIMAIARGIPTEKAYFSSPVAGSLRAHGSAQLITCTNCFAHVANVHDFMAGVELLLTRDGVFVTESHYLMALLDRLQYDTIYHEHLRYYSLSSLQHLLQAHGFTVFRAQRIPSHGGSIRVYAARIGTRPVQDNVYKLRGAEPRGAALAERLSRFAEEVEASRAELWTLLSTVEGRIVGIGAPSRASTLINYVGLDETDIDYVCEMPGSLKIGKCMPGTGIPIVDEERLYAEQPENAILFSWHIAEEIVPKLRAKGYKGRILVPLAVPGSI